MGRNLNVNVEFLTRVEGHGNIVVNMKEGKLEKCELNIVEAPRLFESMVRGRSIFELPHITSRICGICSCGHTLASIQAAEDALKYIPTKQTVELRKLLLHLENLDSHILHIYMLAAPDMLGKKSAFAMLESNGGDVRRALRMKKLCNDACGVLVGRHVHPISATVGGFTKLPDREALETIRHILMQIKRELEPTLELAAGFKFPDFERDTEYVALTSGSEYAMLSGKVASTDGINADKSEYRKVTNEFIVKHSTAKHAKLSRGSYMVGALARFNINSAKMSVSAKAAADALGLKPVCRNPFLNTAAQLVECFHFADDALVIVERFLEKGVEREQAVTVGLNERRDIDVRAGFGVGAVEVPRGLLFHAYEVDERGIVQKADCVIPTGQNLQNIEDDMAKLAGELGGKTDAEAELAFEMLVRAYDPCISCSTHVVKVKCVR